MGMVSFDTLIVVNADVTVAYDLHKRNMILMKKK
jgi:hypothetical protein